MKLTCCAALWLGLALLGAAGAEAVSCTAAGSLVPNCGFDTDDAGWYFTADQVTWTGTGCANPPGCLEIDRHDGVHVVEAFSACFPVDPLSEYASGAWLRRVSGVISQTCTLEPVLYSDGLCGSFLSNSFVQFTITATWRVQMGGLRTPAGAHSALLRVACDSAASDFVLGLDDALFLPAIFVDGFASGDSGRWSVVVP